MTEAELLHEIMTAALGLGLLVHHCADSRRCHGQPGFPDLTILGLGGLLLAELKSDTGSTSADQDRWIWTMHEAGQRWATWRPADWRSGRIQQTLDRLATIGTTRSNHEDQGHNHVCTICPD